MRAAEDRYFLPATVGLAGFSGVGICFISDYLKKYSKLFSIIFIITILCLGGYYQLKDASSIINNKRESFLQIKQGAEWLGENVPKSSIILGEGLAPYLIYYADLPIIFYNETEKDKNKNADYLIIHAFPPETYLNNYVSQNQDMWNPVAVFFFDKAKQQPGLIIVKNANK